MNDSRIEPGRPSWLLTFPSIVVALALGWFGRAAFAPLETVSEEASGQNGTQESAGQQESAGPEAPAVWTCSMHPQVRDDQPGSCPICGMDLVLLEADSDSGSDFGQPLLPVSEAERARMRIETAPLERRAASMEVRMSGKLALDETRLSSITAWAGGRLDRLFVDATGIDVGAGDHLVEIYSPDLFATQAEFQQLLRLGADNPLSSELLEPARERLRQFGLTPEQIAEVENGADPSDRYTMYAPEAGVVMHRGANEGQWVERGTPIYTIADLSHLWVLLDAYERDLPWLRYGQDVTFETEAYPGEEFHGTIAFLAPELNERTRTVKVRVNVENHDRRLRPGMFVRTVVRAGVDEHGTVLDPAMAGKWLCTMHPEVIADVAEECSVCDMALVPAESLGLVAEEPSGPPPLVVPASAALQTGRRAVVYVEREDPERGFLYEGREVVLGPRVGPWFVVLEGLTEGEQVVLHGAFKIDAELQIRAKPSMMNPVEDTAAATGGVGAPGHSHPADLAAVERVDVPDLRALLKPVWRAYVRIQTAFAGDDTEGIRAASGELLEAAQRIDSSQFPEAEHLDALIYLRDVDVSESSADITYTHTSSGLVVMAEELARPLELDEARGLFSTLSRQMEELVRRYGVDDATVRRMECPMAFDGDGGTWLQEDAELLNPYFGAAMLRCGSELEILEQMETGR